jgi:hypothetical protein
MENTSLPENKQESKKEETFLYHMVPDDMHGNTLHPLNSLADLNPDLYLSKKKKYKDREHVMEQFIPTLKCVWNDVLHFSAINPVELKKALIESGMDPKEMKFYQIDPNLLNPKNTTIYLYQEKSNEDAMNSKNFLEYDPEKLAEHSALSQATKDYYREKNSNSERPLLFVGINHILHKGSIDISDLPIIVV